MKRIAAAFLSLILFLLPVFSFAETSLTTEEVLEYIFEGLDDSVSGYKPGLSATLTSPEGEAISIGFGQTDSGFSANYTLPALTLLLTESTAYLIDGSGSASVALEALLSTLAYAANGGQPIPALTEDELQLLADAGMKLLNGVLTSSCLTVGMNGNITNLHIDLDGLMDLLDELVPQALSADPEKMDAFLAKITPFLFGEVVTLEQLTALWSQLGLKNIQTGLTLDVMLLTDANGVSLIASCKGWNVRFELNGTHFTFTFTSPEGVAYAFDTNDLLTVAGILSTVPASITEEAFKVEQTTSDKVYNGRTLTGAIVTTYIKTDLALVMRDLVSGLKNAISVNSLSVDTLLKKYQPWIDLFTPVTIDATGNPVPRAEITARQIVKLLDGYRVSQSIPGEATIVVDQYFETITVDGYLSDMLFEADICISGEPSTIDAAIRVPGRYSTFELTLTGSTDGDEFSQYTLACSEDLGGFHAVTLGISNPSYSESVISITTDTDMFHFTVDTDRNNGIFDVKLGSFLLTFTQPFYSTMQPQTDLHASWPGGFVDLIVADNSMELDSNYLGFSFTETRSVIHAEGYVNEYTASMRPSSFSFMLDNENEILTLSILPYNDGNTHITYRTGRLSILSNEEELVIADAHTGTSTQNITTVSIDGETMLTLVSDVINDEDVTIRMYAGTDTTGECWQLHLDFGAAGMTPPADAAAVTADEFINRLNSALNPPAEEPAAVENP